MGNGAIGPQKPGLTYEGVENLLRRGRGGNPGEEEELLRQLFMEAIRTEQLDVLELLNQNSSPSSRGIQALRLASEACKAEALDHLLLTASRDDGSDLSECLLLVAGSLELEKSSHCAALLLNAGGDALLSARTLAGESVFHCAARTNNAPFVRAVSAIASTSLKKMLKILKAKDSQGRTPTQIATNKRHNEVVAAFNDIIRSGVRGEKRYETKDEVVDQARIMAVWNRFFENAARLMMGEEFVSDEMPPVVTSPKTASSGSKMARQMLMAWYQHFCCCCQATGECYLVNKSNGASGGWLDEFLAPYASFLSVSTSLPTSPESALRSGWICYFDPESNSTSFFNILTWAQPVTSLPLGAGEGRRVCLEAGLASCGDANDPHDVWFCPDNVLGRAWVQVSRTQDASAVRNTVSAKADNWSDWEAQQQPTAELGVYYWNLLSGQTCLYPPPFFQTYEGWILCCEEDDFQHLFWFCEHTGESVWCD